MKPWRQFGQDAYGTVGTGYLLVGEAPGYVSWRNRRRFTGLAGLLIRRALSQLNHVRYTHLEDLFYMTDVVKCHPAPPANRQSNRAPSPSEIASCACYLERELRLLRPSVIVTFGKTASEGVARVLPRGSANGRRPEVVAFPHPSPRNQQTILKAYPSMQAFQDTIAGTFRRLIARLDKGKTSWVKRKC